MRKNKNVKKNQIEWSPTQGKQLIYNDGKYTFLNEDGSVFFDGNFYGTPFCEDGFAVIQDIPEGEEIPGKLSFLDLLGNVSTERTYKGVQYKKYLDGDITKEEILSDPQLKDDEQIIEAVTAREENKKAVEPNKKRKLSKKDKKQFKQIEEYDFEM